MSWPEFESRSLWSTKSLHIPGASSGLRTLLGRLLGAIVLMLQFGVAVCGAASGWESGPGFRNRSLEVPPGSRVGFTRLSSGITGLNFTNLLSEQRHLTNQILLNGSGVAAGDVDGDGLCDLYFCGLDSSNALYRNLGNWRFQDITASAGVACADLDATGAAFADLDGDGDLDLIVNSVGGGTHVFLNNGKGQFLETARLNRRKGATSLAVADLDGDGYLDLYIANYRTSALMDIPNARATFKIVEGKTVVDRLNGRPVTEPDLVDRFIFDDRGRVVEQGEVDSLYLNQRGTNFTLLSFTSGAFVDETGKKLSAAPFDWGLSVQIRDLNGDGQPDIYVCNDFESPDRIWINLRGGRFQALPRLALRKNSLFSMGVDFADLNHDGFDDFVVLDMVSRDHRQRMMQIADLPYPPTAVSRIEGRPQYNINTLFLNRGDGTYAEIAQLSGLEAAEWAWSPIFLDVDLDGWEDLLVANGHERAARDADVAESLKKMRATRRMSDAEIFQARKMFPRLDTANLAFRNRGDLTFEEVGRQWNFADRGISHGMALADLDGDGDIDVIVNNLNGEAGIYRNESSAPRLSIQLKGLPPNTHGIGARIQVMGGAVSRQSQEIIAGGRYLSSDEALRTFAAGSTTNEMLVEVTWRSGRQSVVPNATPNRLYEIEEIASAPFVSRGPGGKTNEVNSVLAETKRRSVTTSAVSPLFQDVSSSLAHTHEDETFDDFARQPLLPNRLSQLGPGVSWFDLDGDGWDDLIVGSGKGGRLGVFRNDGRGGFKRTDEAPFNFPVARDQTTILGWRSASQTLLFAGSANYEDGLAIGGCVRVFDVRNRKMDDRFPASPSSSGPLALADIDGDGQLDLFVGGRVVPGKYPRAASSVIFRRAGGQFIIDQENTRRLAEIGLISGAVFCDLDSDGDPDLILACDWGPIRIFRNDRGEFTPWNPSVQRTELPILNDQPPTFNVPRFSLSELTGFWNGVAVGDFDGDGRMDIVASNWGRNSKYESHRQKPLQIYYGSLGVSGHYDLLEAHFDAEIQKVVPDRSLDVLVAALPFLKERYPTHRAFASSSISELLGERTNAMQTVEARWLESTVFLNRGVYFEARVLPVEAQMAPAFGVCVGDLDGDGHEDLFLSQNFFTTQPETPRYDAGRGLLLRGDGHGQFQAMNGQMSGIQVYGEQRGCALGDYDADGRADLVVTQNSNSTRLYHNVGARPGLRVRLKGDDGNSGAYGASLRLLFGERKGPLREIHAGSGYWSQDSAIQVMATPEIPTGLWVRWPNGKTFQADLPSLAREVEVEISGSTHLIP